MFLWREAWRVVTPPHCRARAGIGLDPVRQDRPAMFEPIRQQIVVVLAVEQHEAVDFRG